MKHEQTINCAQYGPYPQADWLLYGVKPLVVTVVLQALWHLDQKAFKDWLTGFMVVVVLVLYFFDINEIALLFGGKLVILIMHLQVFLGH